MFSKKESEEETQPIGEKSTEAIKEENEHLFSKLTNKNQDYFVQLDRRLDKEASDPHKKLIILNQMMNETVDFQEDAITARRRYGTVTERVEEIHSLDPTLLEGEPEESPAWMRYMNGALFLGGLFNLITGLGAMRSAGTVNDLTLFQFILNFLLGGFVAMVLTRYRPERGKTKGFLKYTAVTVAVVFVFVFIMNLVDYLVPTGLNPGIAPTIVTASGLIALALSWYLKEKLNIIGTLF